MDRDVEYDDEPDPEREPDESSDDHEADLPETTRDGDPDVLLDVPQLHVDEIGLEVENLRAKVLLQAEVLDMLKLNVGADVALDRVQLDIKGVDAQALLKVRLDNVAQVVGRVLTTIDRNPQILEHLTEGLGAATEEIGGGAREAVGELGRGAGSAVEEVGEGAGSAVEDVGEGAGSAVEDVGEGAGSAVEDVGEGAGSAVEDVGEGAGTRWRMSGRVPVRLSRMSARARAKPPAPRARVRGRSSTSPAAPCGRPGRRPPVLRSAPAVPRPAGLRRAHGSGPSTADSVENRHESTAQPMSRRTPTSR